MQITGDIELIDALDNAQQRVGARGAGVLRATGMRIERSAKQKVRVDTGNLRGSIGSTTSGDGRNGTMRVEIGPTASYGVYVETGTSRMAAYPYLFPAVDEHLESYYSALERIAGDV